MARKAPAAGDVVQPGPRASDRHRPLATRITENAAAAQEALDGLHEALRAGGDTREHRVRMVDVEMERRRLEAEQAELEAQEAALLAQQRHDRAGEILAALELDRRMSMAPLMPPAMHDLPDQRILNPIPPRW